MKKINNHRLLVTLAFSIILVFGVITTLKSRFNPLNMENMFVKLAHS
jgi:hypothetical protein